MLPLAASPVGHERGAIVFRTLAREAASEARILDLPALNRIASAQRSPKAPDAGTMTEQGVKDFTAASYVGILAPAATPAEIVKALEGALIKALSSKETQDKFLNTGAELVPDALMTSKGFGDYIKKEYELAAEAAKIAGLKPA